MKLCQVIEFLDEEFRVTANEMRYWKLDEAINCLVDTEEKIEAFDEAFLEIGELTQVYKDLKQPETALREALENIDELADASAAEMVR